MAKIQVSTWRRRINRRSLLISAVIGMVLVYSSVLILHGDYVRILAITAGLVVLEVGIWYAASPFLTNERRYLALRTELDGFVKLVRELNTAVISEAGADQVEQVRSKMHESVDQMTELAGKTD